jgi:ubiquitin-protein ligase E3 D
MPKPKIVLYAETLTHIKQLTLHATLQTEKNEHTKVLVSSDKKIITVLHEGESSAIYLPTQISGTAYVTFPYDRRTEISTRLQIEDSEQLYEPKEESGLVEVPWSAGSMSEQTSITCSQCDATILSTGQTSDWRDMPSESWADLMDLWYCHKPHDNNIQDNDHAAQVRGFSAKSKLVAGPGLCLIDTVSFLLDRHDCANIEVSPPFCLSHERRKHFPNLASRKKLFRFWNRESVEPVSDTVATD